MITIADILKPEQIDLDLKMKNQEEAINQVASLLREDERVTDWNAFYRGLSSKQPALAGALGQGAVGANDAVPREVGIVALVQHGAGHPRRPGRHVAVGAHEALGYRANAVEDARGTRLAVESSGGPGHRESVGGRPAQA